jgi:hypothetical protein
VFDPERDRDPGASHFYLRLLAVAVIAVAGCVALWPSVTGFSAGPDHDTGCVAISDGWHANKAGSTASDIAAITAASPAPPTPAQQRDPAAMARWRAQWHAAQSNPAVQRANAYEAWLSGPGACVRESRHRLILSGLGLGALALILGGTSIARRTRMNLRHAPQLSREPDAGPVRERVR